MAPISLLAMLSYVGLLLLTVLSPFLLTTVSSQQTEPQNLQQTGLLQSVSDAIDHFISPIQNHGYTGDIVEELPETTPMPSETSLAETNTAANATEIEDEHTRINRELKEDEYRLMSKGEVKIRKKRTFCKSCYPTYSYGYGGGGGCCGQCGQCGGGYRQSYRPIKIKVRIPVFYSGGGRGGGGGCCYQQQPCGVCGRK